MRLRVPDASTAPRDVRYGVQNRSDHRPRPTHLAGAGVYDPRRDSLAQNPNLRLSANG